MSDDLAAKAASWVPPWQRPADGESDAGASGSAAQDDDEGPTPGSGLPGQWDRLAGAKWQTARAGEIPDGESPDNEVPDPDRLDPQLSDCVSDEDELEEDDGDGGSGSWNARAVHAEADEPDFVALSGDERDAESLSGDADGVARVGEADGVGALSGDAGGVSGEADGGVGAVSGDEGGKAAGGKRSRGKRSGDGEGRQAQETAAGADGFEQGQLFVPAQRSPEDTPSISDADLVPALEAILMVVDEPVGEILLAQVLDVPAEKVADALLALSARYTEEGKGFDLRRAAGGWRFYTRAEYSAYVERFVLDGQQLRLTQASLETLAVVAYKQPVTRSRISAIRGVNCDGVVKTLMTRGLIEECGTEPESGAHLYRTTNLFLEKLGLDSVDQLPPLAPFLPDNLDEVAMNE